MNGPEIKARIEEINKKNKELLSPNFWVLNNTVQENLKEIAKLQSQCEHEDDGNGCCKWCYLVLDTEE